MAHTKRTACKYDDGAQPSGWKAEKQSKGKEGKVSGYLSMKKRARSKKKKKKINSSGEEKGYAPRTQ